MKREQLYNKTVNILAQAYFSDLLIHGNCCTCAVGNIVAANMGYVAKEIRNLEKSHWVDKNGNKIAYPGNRPEKGYFGWGAVFCTSVGHRQDLLPENYFGAAKEQIDSTGYSYMELARIEHAFELSQSIYSDDMMFDGLMAIVDVLDEIHENKDESVTVESKKKFNRLVTAQASVATKV